MGIEILAIGLLIAMFIVATIQPINMGALAFAGAFLLGSMIIGMKTTDIFAGFPSDLFLTLVAVTYLFAIAQINGTIDWLVECAVRLVRGRIGLIPWVMFLVAAVITGFGALGPAAVAILAPVALSFAIQYRIHPVMMGLMVIHGAQAGGFSPISIYGGITNQIVAKAGLPFAPTSLFLSSFFFNLAIAVLVFFAFGGAKVMKHVPASSLGPLPELHPEGVSASIRGHGGTPAKPIREHAYGTAADTAATLRLNNERFTTLIGLTALGIGALVFKFNVGLVAMTVAVALALLSPKTQKAAIDKVSWSTVLLIAGIITYVGVMEKAGTVDYVANGISSLGMPLLVALLLCFTGAIVSAFASSTALLGAIIPLAVPFLMQGHVSAIGVVAAIAISTTIVDTSPFSTNGALVVANAPDDRRDQVLKQLLVYSALIAIIGPIVAWLVFVVPGLV
ncbi:UNVERIFIED_ORG: di/tricarboxylate transporter [Rhizobium esperanzae]